MRSLRKRTLKSERKLGDVRQRRDVQRMKKEEQREKEMTKKKRRINASILGANDYQDTERRAEQQVYVKKLSAR